MRCSWKNVLTFALFTSCGIRWDGTSHVTDRHPVRTRSSKTVGGESVQNWNLRIFAWWRLKHSVEMSARFSNLKVGIRELSFLFSTITFPPFYLAHLFWKYFSTYHKEWVDKTLSEFTGDWMVKLVREQWITMHALQDRSSAIRKV